jgi:alkanesulfonate monooxygenase SsuD/methylene tetrahydromethanopterin reductase-like flavin-dependent oxidoreductase (luciferase family)
VAPLQIGFIPIEGGHYYRDALEEVTRAEELGFDSVWMEEHHSVTDHYWPSPLPVLAGFATRTTRMRLGTDILVAPFYHPVRLAEDAAMLDVMSGGRFVPGIAIGYKPDEPGPTAPSSRRWRARGAARDHEGPVDPGNGVPQGTYCKVTGRLEPSPSAASHPGLDRRAGRFCAGRPALPTTDPGADRGPGPPLAAAAVPGQPGGGPDAAGHRAAATRDVIIADTDRGRAARRE